MQYGQSEWSLFFFTYSVLGWVWESLYVSAKKRQWINRGFLYGPWLPIYGFGAIIILFLTLPVREKIIWIFLLGMTGGHDTGIWDRRCYGAVIPCAILGLQRSTVERQWSYLFGSFLGVGRIFRFARPFPAFPGGTACACGPTPKCRCS